MHSHTHIQELKKASLTQFGSGWAWLVSDTKGAPHQCDEPLVTGCYAISEKDATRGKMPPVREIHQCEQLPSVEAPQKGTCQAEQLRTCCMAV
eukprot:348886-Pelagomonas_calceolata.AAC.6